MKVLLVLPWHQKDRSYRNKFSTWLSYAPTTLGTLAAIINHARPDWTIDTIDEISQKINYDKKYDIVMLTLSSTVSKHGYEIADRFRELGTFVVIGGYHAKYNSEEVLNHADSVVIGPAEYSIPKFINDYEQGKAQLVYENVCVKGEDILPPDRSKISLKNYLKYPGLIANPGCPNHCSYCAISDMWRNTSARPVENVIEEIKTLKKKIVIFYDPNFFANRDYAISLMNALIPLKIRWVCSAVINLGYDDELLELAQKSGCNGVLIGFESFSQDSLKTAGKNFNEVARYKELVANIKKYRIMVNGCFILGMDGDTKESLKAIPERVNEMGLNLARFSILTPTPGSELYKKLLSEGRILSTDWSEYTMHKSVYKPKNMTPEELEEIYRWVWKETYSYRNILKRVKRIPSKGISAKFIGFGANIGFKFLGME